ncbi:MAG: hypothetical protein ACE15C_18840 [Phycisphaerae bacterium]
MSRPMLLLAISMAVISAFAASVTAQRYSRPGRDDSYRSSRDQSPPFRSSRDQYQSVRSSRDPAQATGYDLILTRNIFSRDRRPPQPPRPPMGPVSPPMRMPAPSTMLLTGVGVQDEVRIAFFEDTRTNESFWATPGQMLDGGTIMSISLDSIDYKYAGSVHRVSVGEKLPSYSTSYYAPPPTSMPASAESQPAATEPSSQPAGGGDDILEMMRKRRLKELGQ